ncbi:hypothetical protein SAMN02745945_02594 [Peptoclostridium litorale DSM 5388]|uniref:Uncharacterized protein n=1 Tax=Peptoclostridium litorale DSM 5388 TaxID=1121324 RepID=A0A069RER0_PEPLI|nr:hypothetical protein CLIT_14c01310 [Peptoclostridium litorale DSM 5388]SIO29982.1 hypothetical protein SAMN02745945_02594 [Peptoclostridium litorale DSM 5388]
MKLNLKAWKRPKLLRLYTGALTTGEKMKFNTKIKGGAIK